MADESRERFYKILKNFDSGMLTTRALDGELRARPMAMAEVEDDADLWFATGIDSGKIDEIQADPRVAVTFQSDRSWASVTGTGQIVRDRAKIDELWSEAWEVWFPDGKDDPDLVLLRVAVSEGEYWDQSGAKGLKFLAKAAAAYVTDSELQGEDDPDTHGKVNLGG